MRKKTTEKILKKVLTNAKMRDIIPVLTEENRLRKCFNGKPPVEEDVKLN